MDLFCPTRASKSKSRTNLPGSNNNNNNTNGNNGNNQQPASQANNNSHASPGGTMTKSSRLGFSKSKSTSINNVNSKNFNNKPTSNHNPNYTGSTTNTSSTRPIGSTNSHGGSHAGSNNNINNPSRHVNNIHLSAQQINQQQSRGGTIDSLLTQPQQASIHQTNQSSVPLSLILNLQRHRYVKENFKAESEDEISVNKGDLVIWLYESSDPDWTYVSCPSSSKEGFVLTSYLSLEPVLGIVCKKKIPRSVVGGTNMTTNNFNNNNTHHHLNNNINSHEHQLSLHHHQPPLLLTNDHHPHHQMHNHHLNNHNHHHHNQLFHNQININNNMNTIGNNTNNHHLHQNNHNHNNINQEKKSTMNSMSNGCLDPTGIVTPMGKFSSNSENIHLQNQANNQIAANTTVATVNGGQFDQSMKYDLDNDSSADKISLQKCYDMRHNMNSYYNVGDECFTRQQTAMNTCLDSIEHPTSLIPFQLRDLGRYVVLHNFKASEENDLSVRPGDFVTLLNEEDPDWAWVGHEYDGSQGFVPTKFICNYKYAETLLKTNNDTNVTTTTSKINNNPIATIKPTPQINQQDDFHTYMNHPPDNNAAGSVVQANEQSIPS